MPITYAKPDKWIFMNENEICYLFKDFMKKLNKELSQKFNFTWLTNYRFLKNNANLYLTLTIESSSNYVFIREYLKSIFNFRFCNEHYTISNFEYDIQFKVK